MKVFVSSWGIRLLIVRGNLLWDKDWSGHYALTGIDSSMLLDLLDESNFAKQYFILRPQSNSVHRFDFVNCKRIGLAWWQWSPEMHGLAGYVRSCQHLVSRGHKGRLVRELLSIRTVFRSGSSALIILWSKGNGLLVIKPRHTRLPNVHALYREADDPIVECLYQTSRENSSDTWSYLIFVAKSSKHHQEAKMPWKCSNIWTYVFSTN